ncbi:FeoB-associated Cys-rich membrane protein [Bacillus pumilus]|nr:FeoB-associated Cys-rich membrane protein [Bacillus pumilus]UUD43158.1 FeoB-associated Cys-rich membrane protein [Bacillus pumilus]
MMKEPILYFAVSFVLQLIWFGIVHPDKGVTLLDMLIFSILFAVMFFFIERIWRNQKKGRSE